MRPTTPTTRVHPFLSLQHPPTHSRAVLREYLGANHIQICAHLCQIRRHVNSVVWFCINALLLSWSSPTRSFVSFTTHHNDNRAWGLGTSCDAHLIAPLERDRRHLTFRHLARTHSLYAIAHHKPYRSANSVDLLSDNGQINASPPPAIDYRHYCWATMLECGQRRLRRMQDAAVMRLRCFRII
jgi:hypothetical protein